MIGKIPAFPFSSFKASHTLILAMLLTKTSYLTLFFALVLITKLTGAMKI
jgi:hypothetical protein